jgi:hypothetical protein
MHGKAADQVAAIAPIDRTPSDSTFVLRHCFDIRHSTFVIHRQPADAHACQFRKFREKYSRPFPPPTNH